MLKPQNALSAVPNRESILKALEKYTDRILALEVVDGATEIIIVYNGENFHMMKRYVRQFINMYGGYYDVEDITNTRKFVYILKFTPTGL